MPPERMGQINDTILRLGSLMLHAGSASFRVDRAMRRVAASLGADRVETVVNPNVIIATVHSGGESRTQIVRITGLGVDMNRIAELELLSRHAYRHPTEATLSVINAQLDHITKIHNIYPRPLTALAVGMSCAMFALILGGGVPEALSAGVGATTAQALRYTLTDRDLSAPPIAVICAALAALLSYLVHSVGVPLFALPAFGNLMPSLMPRTAQIASVLFLVPGVAFITALLDILRFDLTSGVTRAVYALLLLTCIAVGLLIVLSATGLKL